MDSRVRVSVSVRFRGVRTQTFAVASAAARRAPVSWRSLSSSFLALSDCAMR